MNDSKQVDLIFSIGKESTDTVILKFKGTGLDIDNKAQMKHLEKLCETIAKQMYIIANELNLKP